MGAIMTATIVRALCGALLACAAASAAQGQEMRYRLTNIRLDVEREGWIGQRAQDQLAYVAGAPDARASANARGRTFSLDMLDDSISLDLVRFSPDRAKVGSIPYHADRYKVHQIGLAAHAPIGHLLDATLAGDIAYMRRKLEVVPAAPQRSKTVATRVGIGFARPGGKERLTVQYQNIARAVRRAPAHRLAELLGGAPLNGKGFTLMLSSEADLSPRNRLRMYLIGEAIKRPALDLQIIGAAADTRVDRRATLRFGLTL